MRNLTASGLWRAEACPASATLPQVQAVHADAVAGTAAHAVLEQDVPQGEFAEVAVALNVGTGEAYYLPKQEHRAYPERGPEWIFGTLDRLKVAGGIVVSDHKTGFGYMVAPAKSNLQLAFAALAVARIEKADSATVQILAEGKKPDVAVLGAMELDLIGVRLQRIVNEALSDVPKVIEGPHCWRCGCFARCPAKVSLALALASGIEGRELPTLELTPESVAKGWTRLKQIKAVLGAVESAYRGYAAETPVPLGGGRMLGVVEKARETVDGRVALAVLTDLIGPDLALGAVDLEASKASIQRAMKTADASRGLSGRVAKALDAIRAEGGVGLKRSSNVEEYAE